MTTMLHITSLLNSELFLTMLHTLSGFSMQQFRQTQINLLLMMLNAVLIWSYISQVNLSTFTFALSLLIFEKGEVVNPHPVAFKSQNQQTLFSFTVSQ